MDVRRLPRCNFPPHRTTEPQPAVPDAASSAVLISVFPRNILCFAADRQRSRIDCRTREFAK